jgi:hypothetical protein
LHLFFFNRLYHIFTTHLAILFAFYSSHSYSQHISVSVVNEIPEINAQRRMLTNDRG